MVPQLIFWCSVGALLWVYAGYPLLVGMMARIAPFRLRSIEPPPALIVVIAVHDEAGHIAERIAESSRRSDRVAR